MRNEILSEFDQALYKEHLTFLCLRHRIDLRIIEDVYVQSFPALGRIDMVPIRTIEDYAIGMHEIGHCVLRHRPEQRREWKEILAWKWAGKNSLLWNLQMERHAIYCLKCWGITNPDPKKYL